ncbi:nucleoside hydrolase [Seminavis robusta]|uniref:Nucleoside hydrolase n=1 Tax=Seminavis robusta TaxID=568900 RepID=A0A9N8HC62_9STRA|nr:nucleoside hydrolase [Seminavis robusta]|eukprot:Sro367_g127780.1 nucleoside hydrolase (395) ;mRNA; f:47617-48801
MEAVHTATDNDESIKVPKIWLDADPSGFVWTGLDCDDDLAILTALSLEAQGMIDVEGISVCGGNAPLRHTWKDTQVLLQHAGSSLVPHKGYGWKSMQVSRRWLKWLNRIQPDIDDSNDAVDAIIKASHDVENLIIVTLGPPANFAKALEQDPTLADRIGHVYLMGGELTQQRLCLNFASDRAAARTIVDANVPTTMIPIQLCAQVVMDQLFVDQFAAEYCHNNNNNQRPAAAACGILPKMHQQVAAMPKLVNKAVAKRFPSDGRWSPSVNLDKGFIPWDIVAILAISHPDIFDEWEYHTVQFPTCGPEGREPCDNTMTVGAPPPATPFQHQSGIVRIPHLVRNETQVLGLMKDFLGHTPAQGTTPNMMLGFMGPVFGGIVAGAALALWKIKLFF